jgi:hypothetical protein
MFTASQEIQDWLTQCAKVRINRWTSWKNVGKWRHFLLCIKLFCFFLTSVWFGGKSVASLVAMLSKFSTYVFKFEFGELPISKVAAHIRIGMFIRIRIFPSRISKEFKYI